MRLAAIDNYKRHRSVSQQQLEQGLSRNLAYRPASDYKRNYFSQIKNFLHPKLHRLSQSHWRNQAGLTSCDWAISFSIDGKYTAGVIAERIHNSFTNIRKTNVLLPGCNFNSQETRDWLRLGSQSIALIDIVNWTDSPEYICERIFKEYRSNVSLNFGTLESLPFEQASFDIIETRAVLEHVGNFEAAAIEMARVLKPSGLCIHTFGPLYFSAGGDHCIGAYGKDHIFDHILLDEDLYQRRLRDELFFRNKDQAVSDSRFWAMKGIFSYLKPREYLTIFNSAGFDTEAHAIISAEAISFRNRNPHQWHKLLKSGLTEEDLLVSGMIVFQRKRT